MIDTNDFEARIETESFNIMISWCRQILNYVVILQSTIGKNERKTVATEYKLILIRQTSLSDSLWNGGRNEFENELLFATMPGQFSAPEAQSQSGQNETISPYVG